MLHNHPQAVRYTWTTLSTISDLLHRRLTSLATVVKASIQLIQHGRAQSMLQLNRLKWIAVGHDYNTIQYKICKAPC